MRELTLTGGLVDRSLAARLRQLFPNARVRNAYTTTEAFPAGTAVDYCPARPGAVGRLDPERVRVAEGRVPGADAIGEIELRAPGVTPRSSASQRRGWRRLGGDRGRRPGGR